MPHTWTFTPDADIRKGVKKAATAVFGRGRKPKKGWRSRLINQRLREAMAELGREARTT